MPVLLRILDIIHLTNFSFAWGFIKNSISLFDSIGIGVLMGFLYYYHQEFYINHKKGIFLIGSFLFLISVIGLFVFNNPTIVMELLRLIDILVLNFSISFMIPLLSQMKQLTNKTITYSITEISLISYSLYLTHTTIIEVFYKTFTIQGLQGYLQTFISLILVFALAEILYHVYEKPMTALRDKK
jgi:peptidoglycan/LPS O-acetylase OafA/YrhL